MKAAAAYESIIRGVSQQVPQDRAPGQHTEQVNMLSDPVNGLTRRHGSVMEAEKKLTALSAAKMAGYLADTDNYTTINYTHESNEYTVLVRRKAIPAGAGYTAASADRLPFMLAYNRTSGQFLNLSRTVVDTNIDALENGGASAVTAVGKFLYLTGNTVPVAGTSTDKWNTTANLERTVLWIRGGAYSRTYSVTVTNLSNSRYTYTYMTPSSSYQTALDTSDILTADPDYTKKVNDRVNAYNSAVTAWIGTSTAAIQPAAIAEALRLLIAAAPGVTTTRTGSHVLLTGVKSIEVDDGGDGSLIRGVGDEIESVDKTSVLHWIGKVVKVRSRNASEAFYLKAVPKDKTITSGFAEVTWVEGAGVEHAVTGGFFFSTVVGTTMYLASTPAGLTALSGVTTPAFSVSTAGDSDSATRPYFIGQTVTYLDTFQNRLLVGAGGVVCASKIDDYLNFFRSTVLTAPADDPVEMQAQGPNDDVLRHGTLYDQNLVIFGDKRQYIISGRVALTPTSANMGVMSNYADVVDAPPVTAGGFIFYANRGTNYSSVHQIQPGRNDNSPESFPASSQIDSYIRGGIIEVATVSNPTMLVVRSTGARDTLYTFGYLDSPEGRKLDTWSRWTFNEAVGPVVGLKAVPDGVLSFHLRVSGSDVWIVADLCSVARTLSDNPYFDSQRPVAHVETGTGSVTTSTTGDWFAAFNDESVRRLIGSPLADLAALQAEFPAEPGIMVGAMQDAYFEPTSPFMRDQKNKAILTGRLTVSLVTVAFSNSSGFISQVVVPSVATESVTFNGRIADNPDNLIGQVPITSGQATIPVGRETRKYSLRISGRTWLPLTVTALEWVGQFFNRVQRF
jgi:hypothetical protein